MLFTKMTATTGFYLHPYFCFRKHANSNNGFTCGFDVGPVAAVTAVAEVLHRPHVSEVIAIVGVAVTPTAPEFVAVTGVPEVLNVAHVPAVLAVSAIGPVQHDFHGIFQHRIPNWNSQIWTVMSKPNVFKKNSPQHQILHQNLGQGYSTLFQIIYHRHPTLGKLPHLLIRAPPVQLAAETVAQYFQHCNKYIFTRASLEDNQNSLDKPS